MLRTLICLMVFLTIGLSTATAATVSHDPADYTPAEMTLDTDNVLIEATAEEALYCKITRPDGTERVCFFCPCPDLPPAPPAPSDEEGEDAP